VERGSSEHLANLILVLATAACVSTGQILWKLAAQKALDGAPIAISTLGKVLLSPWFFVGCVAQGVGLVLWLSQLSRLPLSTAFALTAGLVFLVALTGDTLLFSVPLSPMRLIGGIVILAGIALSSWS